MSEQQQAPAVALVSRRGLHDDFGIDWSGKTIDRWEAAGKFPRRLYTPGRQCAWVRSEVEAWVKAQIEPRDNGTQQSRPMPAPETRKRARVAP